MNDTGTQLYPAERVAGMDIGDMRRMIECAQADEQNPTTVYGGMTRDETVATARRTVADLTKAVAQRGVERVHAQR